MTAAQQVRPWTGGCLCGALRWRSSRPPSFMGHCYCADCRKASGSGFVPFIGFAADALVITGAAESFCSPSAAGGESRRNFCPTCGGLVFGGEIGKDEEYTVYAGSLDDPNLFEPRIAIFNHDRPDWAPLPDGLAAVFDRMPE